MKILLFGDVHGNLSCLNKLISTEDFKTADKVIFMGDAITIFTRPNGCVKLLNSLGIDCLIGNNDYYVTYKVPDSVYNNFVQDKINHLKFTQKFVNSSSKEIMKTWKKDIRLNIQGVQLYFCHYKWNDEYDVDNIPSKIDLLSRQVMFNDIDADYIFFAHEHFENKFYDNKKHYVCVGSLGMKSPSYYLVIDINNGQVNLQDKYLEYNVEKEIKLLENFEYPWDKKNIIELVKKDNNLI